mgnify:FL=1
MAKQFIISIGREYGSGGRVIAEHLAKTLNVKFYDKNIIELIAQEKKLNLDQLKKYDEKARNIWLSRSVDGLSNSPEDTIAQMQFDFLKERAQAGESFVVLGRCASYILRDFDCMIKVFVTSDMHHKTERIASIEHLDPVMVEDMIIKNNKKRKAYHNFYSKEKWGDSRYYDLIISTSKIGIDGACDVVLDYVNKIIED